MAQTVTTKPKPVLITHHLPRERTRASVGAQDFDKRTTATKPIRGGRSLRGGRR
jgi:hypothetical protein